jgi:hypothetical protein
MVMAGIQQQQEDKGRSEEERPSICKRKVRKDLNKLSELQFQANLEKWNKAWWV